MNHYDNHSLENQLFADNKLRWAKVYLTESNTHDDHHPHPGTHPQITQTRKAQTKEAPV